MAKKLSQGSVFVQKAKNIFSATKKASIRAKTKVLTYADARPLPAFFMLLGALLALIILGNFIRTPKATPESGVHEPKHVEVYGIGESPKIQLTAKVEKTGVLTIVAQSGGIVQNVHVTPGAQVNRGAALVSLSTNYQGGSIPGVTRQIAQKNYDFVQGNYDTQKEMIQKRRDIANKSDDMAGELRTIANQSISDTKTLISLNEGIVNSIDANIAYLEATNVGGSNDADILQAKSGKASVLGGLLSLKSALRNTEYQSSNDQEPADLSRISRDLTQKQLDLEERSLDLNRELSKLNLTLARISESLLYPTSPVSGVVERVYVNPGEQVNAGAPLVTISGNTGSLRLIALVGSEMASEVSRIEPTVVHIGDKMVEVTPLYVSREPTDGALHAIVYILPEEFEAVLTNASFVNVSVPMASQKSSASVPFVPLDAVFQTQGGAYVFVASASADASRTAVSREVKLGDVIGSFVRVETGLTTGDQIILNRNVVAGDVVTIE
jgi:multidrug efflux pump subunit AcrA (membrane-fusion protein)